MRRLAVAMFFLAGLAAGAHAQSSPAVVEPTGLQLSRVELQQLLAEFEQTVSSDEYSGELRNRAKEEAALIRARLEEGDMRVGDRILLTVEGNTELTDTFNVVAGRVVVLPAIGTVELAGVLRSELQQYFRDRISRYLVNPTVHARSLIRVEIMGAVGRPGYYTVPSDLLLGEALMMAGGPQQNAQLKKLKIVRGDQEIWSGSALRDAMTEGRTLDQLSLRAGDGIVLPAPTSRGTMIRNGLLSASTALVLAKTLGIL